jgi:hypothetical protein
MTVTATDAHADDARDAYFAARTTYLNTCDSESAAAMKEARNNYTTAQTAAFHEAIAEARKLRAARLAAE